MNRSRDPEGVKNQQEEVDDAWIVGNTLVFAKQQSKSHVHLPTYSGTSIIQTSVTRISLQLEIYCVPLHFIY